jgi:hypothetical protein
MDDLTALERQIGTELRREIGMVPSFDAMAIARSAIATTPPGRWSVVTRRLRGGVSARTEGGFHMFSALKFVAAGVIVALFGGVLLAGILTTQPGDELAPAAVTETPSPTTTEGPLSCGEGLGMVTLEVGDLLEKRDLELSAVVAGDSVPDPPPELIELVMGKATMDATGSGCYEPGMLNLTIVIGEPPCTWQWGPVCGEDMALGSGKVEYRCDTSFEMLPGEDIWISIEPVPEFVDLESSGACPVWSLVHHPS